MPTSISKVTHCIVYSILFGLYSLSYVHEVLVLSEIKAKRPDIINPHYGGRFKYFTYINAVYSYVYYIQQKN